MVKLFNSLYLWLHQLPSGVRKSASLVVDVLLIGMAFLSAIYLRFGYIDFSLKWVTEATGILLLVALLIVPWSGMHRSAWRYASLHDFVIILRTITIAVFVHTLVLFLVSRLDSLPRSVPLLTWFIGLVYLSGPRVMFRLLRDRWMATVFTSSPKTERERIALYGSVDVAELFIRGLRQRSNVPYKVAAIFTDNREHFGSRIQGIDVLGGAAELEKYQEKRIAAGRAPFSKVVLTSREVGIESVRELVRLSSRLGFTLERIPDMGRFESGEQVVNPHMDFKAVELEDVLGRPSVKLDLASISRMIEGRRVLVTGAGGSIGSELTRQIASFKPSRLIMLDNSEYNLFAIDRDITDQYVQIETEAVICSVRDRERVFRIMEQQRPALVFHAAALKHVPLVEFNPGEGVLTNVAGTRNVADAARHVEADGFVMVSTDKAVNPTSVMGSTKRLAEHYCQSLDLQDQAGSDEKQTRFMTVRFGNVLGSAGSVVPHFERQIRRGGPVTVTHPEIERYFMTVREAVELILQATSHGLNNSNDLGQIYVLEMGQPIKIKDLAQQMIRLAGFEPDTDISIIYTGLRPGEKLMEELFNPNEPLVKIDVNGLLCARARPLDLKLYNRTLDELIEAAKLDDDQKLATMITNILPEYTPSGNIKRVMKNDSAGNTPPDLRIVKSNDQDQD